VNGILPELFNFVFSNGKEIPNHMKRILVTSLAVILLAGISAAQNQLENPGFEAWEDVFAAGGDTIREPIEWSSLKTSDNSSMSNMAPVVCIRSSDAHSGKYSIQLTNIMSFLVVNGVATCGRIHPNITTSLAYMFTDTINSQWNTPFTSRPDSITGWYKYAPKADDTLQVKIALHRGFGKIPDAASKTNWVGMALFKSPRNTGSNWVRFSVPFTYYSEKTPQYILVVLNSGNGFQPVAGSIVHFDDLEMIYNSPQSFLDNTEAPLSFIYAVDNRYLVIQGMKPDNFPSAVIRDLTGRLVWAGNVTADRIDISSANLKKGIYLVTLVGKSDVYSQKIMLH
jgi:hypothetical protein